jgi:signal transduction histidine kinase
VGVGRPVLQFALTGLVTLVVVTVGGVFAFRSTGTRESIREARALTEAIAVGAERRRAEGHLGLDLLRDRARDLGGRLEVDSEPGRGTTVTLEVGAR